MEGKRRLRQSARWRSTTPRRRRADAGELGAQVRIKLVAAKGMPYLHEDCHPKVIHRDIKAANILLDDNFEPKLPTLGWSRSSTEMTTMFLPG